MFTTKLNNYYLILISLLSYKQKTLLLGVVSYGTNYFYMYAILKAQNQSVVLHFLQISFFKP